MSMRQMIGRLLGLKPAADAAPSSTTASGSRASKKRVAGDPLDSRNTIEDNSDNGTRRQLVQMLMRDCLRRNGIDTAWVDCQMLVVNSRSRGSGMYVRLVMRQWDLRLLTYAYAFQKELLTAIHQFEPRADSWLYGVSWELNVGNTCPYPDMPDAAIWQDSPVADEPVAVPAAATAAAAAAVATAIAATATAAPDAAAVAAHDQDAQVLRDLEALQNMFASGDASQSSRAAAGKASDFLPTQPGSM